MAAPVLAIVGATATGKSALAMALAREVGDIELVSADALQVYRGMDIGTAKPTPVERRDVRHHLVDVADPAEEYSLARFLEEARAAIDDIAARGRRAVVVGGTGLYVQALIDDLELPGQWPEVRLELDAEPDTRALHARLGALDPLAASRMEPSNRRRIVRALEVCLGSGRPFSSFGPGLDRYPPRRTALVGLDVAGDVLDERIAARVGAMIDLGLVREVRALGAGPISRTAAQGLGYRQLLAHLAGACSLPEAIEATVVATRQFARRQRRWFGRDPRVRWLDPMRATRELVTQVEHLHAE